MNFLCSHDETMIRPAFIEDVDALEHLENQSFSTDRLSRRNLRYLLSNANATALVEAQGETILGYALILYHRGRSLARLYSLVVDPKLQGKGIGAALLQAAEKDAFAKDCVGMRLEVRNDNVAAIRLYENSGYRKIELIPDYYRDQAAAIRYEKGLVPHLEPDMVSVPFYEQTTDFTCGPASLLMGMKALDSQLNIDRSLELKIWRESTTIFMMSGHGGCGPLGLALSAYHRGFDVEVYLNDTGTLFIDSVRDPAKKEIVKLVQQDQEEEIRRSSIRLKYKKLSVAEIQKKFGLGQIPIVLISSYRIYHEKKPHWVVITGFDDRFIYVHDSFVDYEEGESAKDSINMPILKKDFERMSRYGKAGQKAVLFLKKRSSAIQWT